MFYNHEVLELLKEIIHKENHIMSAIDDLNAAVTQLSTSISNEITALQAALANNNDAAIETAVTNINALNTQLVASVTPPAPPSA
jgi:outer membrane murein-binding lipoprotein Lpp